MYCSECGNTLSTNAKFCPTCGASVSAVLSTARREPVYEPLHQLQNDRTRFDYREEKRATDSFWSFLYWLIPLLVIVFLVKAYFADKLATVKREARATSPQSENYEKKVDDAVAAYTSKPMTASDLAWMIESKNKSLPMMVDRFTELSQIDAGPGMLATYRYRLLADGIAKQKISELSVEGAKRDTIQQACTSMRWGLESGVRYDFVYRSSTGADLFTLTVTAADCVNVWQARRG